MSYPTISRYSESLSQPSGLFRTLGEPLCERDSYGNPKIYAGGNSAVFPIESDGKRWALKCFTRPVARAQEICEYLNSIPSPLFCRTRYLPEELYVYDSDRSGRWHDVVITEWAEGHTLDYRIRKAIHDGDQAALSALADSFDRMALEMLPAEWAHGDLKPENIVVSPDGQMRLIDYDALFFPLLEGSPSDQLGTPFWQHPRRNRYFFNPHADDYPAAMVSATLHILAAEPSLYGRFGEGDMFLFHPQAVCEGTSEAFAYLKDRAARQCNAPLYRLLCTLAYPTPLIEGLPDIIRSFRAEPAADSQKPELVNHGHLWGYRDAGGKLLIPALYDSALEFSEGLAAVSLGGRNHFIDTAGRRAIDCSGYEKINSFSGGLAAVCRDSLWGCIDKTGRVVVEPQHPTARFAGIKHNRSTCTLQE